MSALKTAALAVTIAGGLFTAVEAQAYDQWGRGPGYGHYQPHHHYYSAPTYVHPRIARKQAELQERIYRRQARQQERIVEKYGYQQPWGYGYHQPRGHWGHHYPQRHVYRHHYGW